MFQAIAQFFTAVPFWELLLILVSKMIEVSIGTLRHILINKGYKKQGAILSFFEVLLWVIIASLVIQGIAEAPIKAITYSLGFAIGVYLGSLLESYFALGKLLIHVNCSLSSSKKTIQAIRDAGFGVTSIDAHGKDSDRIILMVFTNRKGHKELVELIYAIDPKTMIVANEVSVIKGGYITPWRRIHK